MEKEKPISLKHNEFKHQLIDLVNNCGLPGWVIEDVLQLVIQDVQKINIQQLDADIKNYESEAV